MASASDVAQRLDDATADHRLLEHPFYKAWANGTLKLEDLRHYSTQYWRQVEAFPGYLQALAERLQHPPAREVIEANLADERDGDHPGLWLDFAAAMGAQPSEVRATTIEPETASCVEAFAHGVSHEDVAFGLGMLYGYESQTPTVAQTKVRGLRDHYGIDTEGVAYFELHGELDVAHARELASAIVEVADDEDSVADAQAGARAGAEAVWSLLDGVCRVRGIAC